MTRARRHFIRPLAIGLAAIALSGCASTIAGSDGLYATPIGNAPVVSNETPYSRGLSCIAGYHSGIAAPRIAVGQIADYTGKAEADGSGRKITQGAALMAISALNKAGVRLVERFDTSVAELELRYANNKLIGDDDVNPDYRRILAGSIPGSDYYIVGGITELNYNIRSNGGSLDVGGLNPFDVRGTLSANAYVMNVGLDLRLVDTNTLEVIDVISYQKQIVARQIQAGILDVLGTTVVAAGLGDSALEPIQLAVRAVIERAVLEMVARLYAIGPDVCRGSVGSDPLADSYDPAPLPQARTAYAPPAPAVYSEPLSPPPPAPNYSAPAYGPPANVRGSAYPEPPPPPAYTAPNYGSSYENYSTPAPQQPAYNPPPAYSYEENYNAQTRNDPYRWYSAVGSNDSPSGSPDLRR